MPDYLLDTPSEEATSRLLLIKADLSGLCWDPFFLSQRVLFTGGRQLSEAILFLVVRDQQFPGSPGPPRNWWSGTTFPDPSLFLGFDGVWNLDA